MFMSKTKKKRWQHPEMGSSTNKMIRQANINKNEYTYTSRLNQTLLCFNKINILKVW